MTAPRRPNAAGDSSWGRPRLARRGRRVGRCPVRRGRRVGRCPVRRGRRVGRCPVRRGRRVGRCPVRRGRRVGRCPVRRGRRVGRCPVRRGRRAGRSPPFAPGSAARPSPPFAPGVAGRRPSLVEPAGQPLPSVKLGGEAGLRGLAIEVAGSPPVCGDGEAAPGLRLLGPELRVGSRRAGTRHRAVGDRDTVAARSCCYATQAGPREGH